VKSSNVSFLNEILGSLSKNKSVEYFKLRKDGFEKVDLGEFNIEALRFIEDHSSLRSLILRDLNFTNAQMVWINECLMKNESLTKLDFSFSNFKGPFEFIKKKNVKSFIFMNIWKYIDNEYLGEFTKCLKKNDSLIHLNISKWDGFDLNRLSEINEVIDCLKKHKTIQSIEMDNFYYQSIKFHQLLENPNLKKLSLSASCKTLDNLESLMEALNKNDTLDSLNISFNVFHHGSQLQRNKFKKIKITNKNLKCLYMPRKFNFSE
jgi:hypothetical protein